MGQGEEGADRVRFGIKVGKINPTIISLIEEAQIIEITGWTPEELGNQDCEKIQAYKIIWSAKGAVSKRERKELNKIG